MSTVRRRLLSVVLALAAGITAAAGVTTADQPQTVDGMVIYLGAPPPW